MIMTYLDQIIYIYIIYIYMMHTFRAEFAGKLRRDVPRATLAQSWNTWLTVFLGEVVLESQALSEILRKLWWFQKTSQHALE